MQPLTHGGNDAALDAALDVSCAGVGNSGLGLGGHPFMSL